MCKDGIVMGGRLGWRKNCKFNKQCTLFVYVWEWKEDWEREQKWREGKGGKERLRRSFNVWENVFLAEKMNRAARLSYLLLKSRSSPADQQASGLIMYLHSKNIHPDTSVATPLPLFTCLSPAISPVWFHLHKFFLLEVIWGSFHKLLADSSTFITVPFFLNLCFLK